MSTVQSASRRESNSSPHQLQTKGHLIFRPTRIWLHLFGEWWAQFHSPIDDCRLIQTIGVARLCPCGIQYKKFVELFSIQ